MVFRNFLYLLGVICHFSCNLFAQEVSAPSYIKSLLLYNPNNDDSTPVIHQGEELILIFDDLSNTYKRYYYTIEHCNYDWKKSDRFTSEYLSPYSESYIKDYQSSLSASVPYIHYRLKFPNEELKISGSGNYLLKIYTENSEKSLFTKRFVVVEPQAKVKMDIRRAAGKEAYRKQSISFEVLFGAEKLSNFPQNVHTSIIKNNHWTEIIERNQPEFIQSDRIIYAYHPEGDFEGGNEYRFFDTKNLLAVNLSVERVKEGEGLIHTFLRKDFPRRDYENTPDINGRFIIRTNDLPYEDLSDIYGEYSMVYFSLEMPTLPPQEELYVTGAFNNWALNEENRMNYNKDSGAYEKSLMLKQGYYNYQYVLKNKSTGVTSYTNIDGSYWQTENDYTILIYYRAPDERYDRVIAYGRKSSKKDFYNSFLK